MATSIYRSSRTTAPSTLDPAAAQTREGKTIPEPCKLFISKRRNRTQSDGKEKAVLVSGVSSNHHTEKNTLEPTLPLLSSLSPSFAEAQAALRHRWEQPHKLMDSGGAGALLALKNWE